MASITAGQAAGANLVRFLDLVAWSEGTSTSLITKNDGYDVIVTGVHGPSVFTDYNDHPFAHGGSVQWKLYPPEFSTAAGRYQVLARYFAVYKAELRLPDFGPLSQDKVALQQIRERRAIPSILAGDVVTAVKLCSGIWASFPGNDYDQGGKALAALQQKWAELNVIPA